MRQGLRFGKIGRCFLLGNRRGGRVDCICVIPFAFLCILTVLQFIVFLTLLLSLINRL